MRHLLAETGTNNSKNVAAAAMIPADKSRGSCPMAFVLLVLPVPLYGFFRVVVALCIQTHNNGTVANATVTVNTTTFSFSSSGAFMLSLNLPLLLPHTTTTILNTRTISGYDVHRSYFLCFSLPYTNI